MAAGGGAGVVTVWNLEERKLHTVLRDAHDAALVGGVKRLCGSWSFVAAIGTAGRKEARIGRGRAEGGSTYP